MEYLAEDSEFAKRMVPHNPKAFIIDYNLIIDKLKAIQQEYPHIDIETMWGCDNLQGSVRYWVNGNCKDARLKAKINQAFE